ncbi:MAG: hypothetical protein M3Y62_03780 [Candidatus Dormibacteraeota bacterium]|nr:hypothetical protein [Candidatus Dormibacteraeota bacterium]
MDDKSAEEKLEENTGSQSGPEREGRHLFGGGPGDQAPPDLDHMKEQLEGGATATSEPGEETPASGPGDLFGSKGVIPKAEDR